VASVRGVGDVAASGNVGDTQDVASGTSPPFHVYSCNWEWDPAGSRTPEKRGDVRDIKRGRYLPVHSGLCLLPNHWNCLKVTRGHFWGHGEGHGAHPDRLGAAETMAAFITSSNQLAHFSPETLILIAGAEKMATVV
jgi:hypothetical protein